MFYTFILHVYVCLNINNISCKFNNLNVIIKYWGMCIHLRSKNCFPCLHSLMQTWRRVWTFENLNAIVWALKPLHNCLRLNRHSATYSTGRWLLHAMIIERFRSSVRSTSFSKRTNLRSKSSYDWMVSAKNAQIHCTVVKLELAWFLISLKTVITW